MRKYRIMFAMLTALVAAGQSSAQTAKENSTSATLITTWKQFAAKQADAPGPRQPTPELVQALVTWISENFDLPTAAQPRIQFVTQHRLAALHARAAEPQTNSALANDQDIVAVYDDSTQTIYLAADWNGSTPGEMSVLVHEMVHHLQNHPSVTFECPQQREKAAYAAQERWLNEFNQTVESEFGIDPFSRLVKSSCIQ